MPVNIRIPTPLRPYTAEQATVAVEAKTVGEAVEALIAQHAGLRHHLLDDAGQLRSFVNLYLNQQDVRGLKGPDTPVREDDTLLIVPAVAGG